MIIYVGSHYLEWETDEITRRVDFDDLIEVYEKQIPKKPIWGTSDYINRHHCVICDGIVGVRQPYCYKCGQKLDWE